ncbi:MAG: hypothetical protein ACRDIB_03790, partial [Ardenticatenaceae bacterium]
MTTASFTQISNASLSVGVAAFLSNLLKQQEVSRSLQKANAARLLKDLNQRLIAGQLKVHEVEDAYESAPGKTLSQLPHGQAVLSLLKGASYLHEGNWRMAGDVISPAQKDNLTKLLAQVVKAIALEHQGDTEGAKEC